MIFLGGFQENQRFAYCNVAFIGTACHITHIVLVTLTESLVFHPNLEHLSFVPFICVTWLIFNML